VETSKQKEAKFISDASMQAKQLIEIKKTINCIFLQEKAQRRPPSKKKKRGKNLSPRNTKACHRISTALLKSVAEIGTQSAKKQ
jgi:hypothetical protein